MLVYQIFKNSQSLSQVLKIISSFQIKSKIKMKRNTKSCNCRIMMMLLSHLIHFLNQRIVLNNLKSYKRKNFRNIYKIKLDRLLNYRFKILLDKLLIQNFQSRQFKKKLKNQYWARVLHFKIKINNSKKIIIRIIEKSKQKKSICSQTYILIIQNILDKNFHKTHNSRTKLHKKV